jgi:hypothetical protein
LKCSSNTKCTATQVLARSIDRLPTDGGSDEENDIDIDLSDSDMEETQPKSRSKASRKGGDDDEAKSFKPNLGAFANDGDSEDDMSDMDSDEEEEGSDAEAFSDAEEFSGFGGGEATLDADSEEDEDEEDEDMVIQEPSLPSDSDFDSDDEAGPAVNLRDFVDSLPGTKKRKVEFEETEGRGKDSADVENKKKRRVLPSMQGPGGRDEGGEFGLNPSKWISVSGSCFAYNYSYATSI